MILGTANVDDPVIKAAVLEVISDAAFFVRLARAQGATSAILNSISSINISGLIDMLGGEDGSSSERGGLSPSSKTLGDAAEYLNAYRETFDLILSEVLGVTKNDAGIYVMDSAKFDTAINSYKLQAGGFDSFIAGVKVANLGYSDITAEDREVFCGFPGLLNYTLITVLSNVEDVVDELGSSLPVGYNTIKEITDAFLLPNGALLDKDPLEATDTIVIPVELETLGDSFDDNADFEAIIVNLELEEKAETFVNNAILLVSLGQSNADGNLILDMLNELKDEMDEE